MLPTEPPAVTNAVAIPRRRTNQRTAVALIGTQEQLIPIGATTTSARATTARFGAAAHNA